MSDNYDEDQENFGGMLDWCVVLNNALDKACDLLNRAQELDCSIFDGILPNDVPDLRNEEDWKEWLMKND